MVNVPCSIYFIVSIDYPATPVFRSVAIARLVTYLCTAFELAFCLLKKSIDSEIWSLLLCGLW